VCFVPVPCWLRTTPTLTAAAMTMTIDAIHHRRWVRGAAAVFEATVDPLRAGEPGLVRTVHFVATTQRISQTPSGCHTVLISRNVVSRSVPGSRDQSGSRRPAFSLA
jgi:hypothetical protein